MSTRQYIGARYVPKFFDWDGSAEWRQGVAYEALTIVTRNGNSYTSKIPVPSNIGAPESNPTYWVATGLYNEQIESIRSGLITAQGDIDTLEGKMDTAEGDIDSLEGRMTTAEGDIDTLEGKMDTAEGDIDSLEDTTNKITTCDPINVLLLGIKNDGSEDCSTLITQASEDHALYFPYGVYRIDQPVYLKNSIYGAGGARLGGKGSVFKCNFTAAEETYVINVVEPYGESVGFQIKNISIDCDSVDYVGGLRFAPNVALVGRPCLFMDDVSVWDVGGYSFGINIAPTTGISRCAYLTNISVTGGSENTEACVKFDQYAGDSSMSNFELMYAKCGVLNYAGSIRLSNCHIYCGRDRSTITNIDTYFGGTRGIDTTAKIIGENIYIDSAYQFWVQRGEGSIIGNLKLWLDWYASDSTLTNGVMVRAVDGATVKVSNLIIGGAASMQAKYVVALGHNVTVGLQSIIAWNAIPTKAGLVPFMTPRVGRQSYSFKASDYGASGTYLEVAVVHVPNNGSCEFSVQRDALHSRVRVIKDGASITVTSLDGGGSGIYYQTSGDYVYFYMLQYGSSINVTQYRSGYGNGEDGRYFVGLVDLMAITDITLTAKSDTTGLTPLAS